MTRVPSSEHRRWLRIDAAASIAVGLTLGSLSFDVPAQQRTDAPRSGFMRTAVGTHPALETAFWICDRAAMSRSVDTGEAIACSTITEDLKAKKFAGDFGAMLAWWQQHRAAEHQVLEAADSATAGR